MRRSNTVLVTCFLLLSFSCGRATVKDMRHAGVVVAGVSFDETSVTVLARHAECATRLEHITVTTPDAATRACLRGLAQGQPIELVERRLQFPLMTCGARPAVTHTVGPCAVPRDTTDIEPSGAACNG